MVGEFKNSFGLGSSLFYESANLRYNAIVVLKLGEAK